MENINIIFLIFPVGFQFHSWSEYLKVVKRFDVCSETPNNLQADKALFVGEIIFLLINLNLQDSLNQSLLDQLEWYEWYHTNL